MSDQPISHSPDLRRLQDEGYEIEITEGHLLVHHVPYVDMDKQVQYGTLVSTLSLAGNKTVRPDSHVVFFAGDQPCDKTGEPLNKLINQSATQQLAEGIAIDHTFSSKPRKGYYADYHEKMTTYVRMLVGQAQALDPDATAQTYRIIEVLDTDSPFEYEENASSRAGIRVATDKLRVAKVAIVGLGGSGGYILDQVAKTPVGEIHLFDGDVFLQHNAFRAPGAASIENLERAPMKVDYFRDIYKRMRRDIIPHADYVDATNAEELREMDFVFLCLDDGAARRLIVERLVDYGISFVDIGMGMSEQDGALAGLLRVTASTPDKREHIEKRIPFESLDELEDDYRQNIQVADLNALNATLAVIKWKKLVGFYSDIEHEHCSFYAVDGNAIINEDTT
jgi:hypothetical protein